MLTKPELVIVLMLLLMSGCTPPGPRTGPAATMPARLATAPPALSLQPTVSALPEEPITFVYTGLKGGIYQVTLSGQKREIVPPDGVLKRVIAWSPDRKYLSYIAVEFPSEGMRETLWMVDASGANARRLMGPVKALRYAWEENGRAIYVEEAISFQRIPFDEGTVVRACVVDLDTGAVQTTAERVGWFPSSSRSPDGNWAVWPDLTNGKCTLYLLDREGNKRRTIYQPPAGYCTGGVWAPDGQRVAIFRPEDEEIYAYDVMSDRWVKVSSLSTTHRDYLVAFMQWSPDGEWLSYTLTDQRYVNALCVLRVGDGSERCFDVRWISNRFAWSHDSRYIAYLAKSSSQENDLFAVNVLDGVITNLTRDGSAIVEDEVAP